MTGHRVWSGSGAWGLGHRDDTAAYLDPGEGLGGPGHCPPALGFRNAQGGSCFQTKTSPTK